jgi:hypothetical protein
VVKNKLFKLIFKNKDNQEIILDYQLHDSIVAEKWFKKISHLKNIPIDKVESQQLDISDLKKIYNELCIFADIKPIDFEIIDQALLNYFHEFYEQTHQSFSLKKNNSILYKFHHSIHYNENVDFHKNKKNIYIGWGTKEGPLTEIFKCNDYYEKEIKKNNIYLPWAELGKRPLVYWKNKEPNDQLRINQLCRPHTTLRASFFISCEDIIPKVLDYEFIKWFAQYKKNWLAHHNIQKWDEIDECSAALLAIANHKEDITNLKFLKILI